jgi:hypothetical protein
MYDIFKIFLFLNSIVSVAVLMVNQMNFRRNIYKAITALFAIICSSASYAQDAEMRDARAEERLRSWINPLTEFSHIAKPGIDSVTIVPSEELVKVYFQASLSYFPFRESHIELFTESLKKELRRRYRKMSLVVSTNGYTLEQLVPNIFRSNLTVDSSRIALKSAVRPVLLRKNESYPVAAGLSGKSIALWQSHGYFYEATLDRWEWQRAKLFGTVEDVSTMAYVLPYLTVMLENAGAITLLPRERDFQTNEVIVDNDRSTGGSEVVIHPADTEIIQSGFLLKDTLFTGDNPFRLGTSIRMKGDTAVYLPEFTEDGYYAVYASWPRSDDNSSQVQYNVHHTGGTTGFLINQTIAGSTWTYLGTFRFNRGKEAQVGSVTVFDASGSGKYIGLDAIRFGGGMGNVARRPWGETVPNQRSVDALAPQEQTIKTDVSRYSWKISGKPRFIEGSRYYLQYAGMPDSLVYSPNLNRNDYNDDYQSRALWINYLIGKPGRDSLKQAGLGIPVDIAFAFHTDAGITPDDSIIGTLAIYSTGAENGLFPDGSSRMASRDLSDIIQTQIVEDIRTGFNSEWTRRGLWDRTYFEARRPNVPSMLLELLSHQNQADQYYGLDPRFRFAVSRSIYKGILRYFAFSDNRPYTVQPLPVREFAITPAGGMKVRLSWEPQPDQLEPTALPDAYMVYKRTGDNGFDNGFITTNTFAEIELENTDLVYSFKITAINSGGESFPSEILAAGISSLGGSPVLVVNGFDRVSGPEWFDNNDMAGVAWWSDRGVPWNYDISPIGDQYDFNRKSPWLDDDAPGWGASYSDMEGKVIPGNTFDFSKVHGSSILNAGHSFYSVSDEYFCSDGFSSLGYGSVNIIMGEEKSTPAFPDKTKMEFSIYTPEFMSRIEAITSSGINVFMSGAYVGTDLELAYGDSTAIRFAARYLRFKPRTGHSVNEGSVYATDIASPAFSGNLSFNTRFSPSVYQVEAPDAIEPAGGGSATAFRYRQNNTSAAVMYKGTYRTVVLGFPFEAIESSSERDLLMKQILTFFEK